MSIVDAIVVNRSGTKLKNRSTLTLPESLVNISTAGFVNSVYSRRAPDRKRRPKVNWDRVAL